MINAAIHGFVLAFPLIMPLGAQNVYVFNQGASQKKFAKVLPVVITAAICDTLLISLAVAGVSFIVFGSFWIKTLLLGVGTLFLIYMGWLTWRSVPATSGQAQTQDSASEQAACGQAMALSSGASGLPPVKEAGLRRQVLFTLSVSLLNPHAILDTVGVIGTNSLNYTGGNKISFAVATVIVSWIWFFSLAWAGRITGTLDASGRLLRLINRVSAVIMWGAAVYMAYTLLK